MVVSRGCACGCHRSSIKIVVEVVEDIAVVEAVVVITVIVITRLEVGVVVVLIVG